jgi:hypothetical protein
MNKKQQVLNNQARRAAKRQSRLITWSVVVVAVALVIFGLSRMSFIAYDEDDIVAVSFSGLSDGQKTDALEAANAARCTCGCGMTLAQCVSTDMTCPIRDSNIEKIKTMVRTAMANGET